jgi:peptidoglycan biosynthesis protein MviN/MurJ (putative lipid II flippase)
MAAIVQGMLSLILLRRRLGRIGDGHLAVTLSKILIASAVMALVVAATNYQLTSWAGGERTSAQVVRLFASIGAGLVAVAVMARVLRITEFDALVDQVRLRFASPPSS